jgi:hypothetical protein
MRAWVPTDSTVALADVPEPTPGPGEALVAVDAYSINRGETLLLERPRPGWRPGKDVAGLVGRGRLHPELGLVRPWTETPYAITELRARRVRGNAVLPTAAPAAAPTL